jgi:hypothetical protein
MKSHTRRIEREEVHFGFPCAAGTEIDTFERSGTLARDVDFRRVTLPAGSTFWHDVDFDYIGVRLSRSTQVHGVEVTRESELEFPPRARVYLHPLLLLLAPWLLFSSWRSRVDGRVTVIPAEPLLLRIGHDEIEVRARDRLGCDRHGVRDLLLASPRDVGEDRLRTGWLTFDRSGAMKGLLLYRSQELRGFSVFGSGLAGTELRFWPSGRLRRFVLADDAVVDGRRWSRGTRIDLDERGCVCGSRPVDIDVGTYVFRPELFDLGRDREEES